MDETQIYALVLGGLFASLVVARLLSWLYQDFLRYKTWLLRLLVYPYLMRRHRLAGPWTRAQVIGYLLYLIANIFSASFRVSSITAAESRTGILSLVNVVPLFFGLHLGFLADLLGISLRTYHWIHSAAASMSMALATTHVILHAVIHGSVSLRARTQLYGVIAATSLLVLFAARIKIVRRPSYELFLRSHQIIAALYAITIWRHVGSRSRSRISLLCIQIIPGVFLSTVLLETAAIIIRNFALRQPYARALIYKKGKAVSLSLSVPRPWNIRAGQYINLWIPGVSFRSFVTLQSHPFTIASWTSGKAMSLDFLIEPRAGFTKLLAQVAERSERPYIAFFSGPHGTPVPVGSFGSVMMVASGFGIAAQLPYLKELIEGYNRCEVRTRRIHLIWQLREQGEETYAEDLVDKALQDDTLDNGYILRVSIFTENRPHDLVPLTKGTHGRLIFYSGTVDLDKMLSADLRGEYVNFHEDGFSHIDGRESGSLVVTVAANVALRDCLREAVLRQSTAYPSTRLFELEYQPLEIERTVWERIRDLLSGSVR